jgi:hypothetical protein
LKLTKPSSEAKPETCTSGFGKRRSPGLVVRTSPFVGLLERKGRVKVVAKTGRRGELHGLVKKHVEPGSEVFN